MKTIRLFLGIALLFFCFKLSAQIEYSNDQQFRVYTADPNVSLDIYFEAIPFSGSIVSVSAEVNGTLLPATLVSGNRQNRSSSLDN